MGQRYRRMVDQNPWPRLARNLDFAKGEGIGRHKFVNC